jgi:hypothetical protein
MTEVHVSPDIAVMTNSESAIHEIIRLHKGKVNAITANEIAADISISGREVRRLINRLRTVFYYKIGSSTGGPAGFYMCETKEELVEVCDWLMKFALKNIITVGKLRNIRTDELVNQVSLELECDFCINLEPSKN